jgi:hypothetical protein
MSPEDPNELSPVERLLRLKRYEKPEEGFVEDFVRSFHIRQREEMLKMSARGLLWERLSAYWSHLITPQRTVAVAGAGVMAFLLMAWTMLPKEVPKSDSVAVRLTDGVEGSDDALMFQFGVEGVLLGVEDEKSSVESSLLLSDHFSGGFADEARLARVTRSQVPPAR